MLLTPRPGITLDNLTQNLRSMRDVAFNLRSGGGASTAQIYLLDYLDWAGQAARTLGNQISEGDLASLVLNRRYEVLLSSFGTMDSPLREAERVVRGLVQLELDERVRDLDLAIKSLASERDRWAKAGVLVLPDSSFYIRHPDKLEAMDFAPLLKLWEESVHVLMPMVIVDELDGLKQASKQPARWRAGYTLAVVDRLFRGTTGPAMLRERDDSPVKSGGIPRGRVNVELLFDPPGHVRLPINDDEIIDRALAVQALAERPVTLLTYDTGQSTRARNAGLTVLKLTEEVGDEPEREQRRQGSSGQRGGA